MHEYHKHDLKFKIEKMGQNYGLMILLTVMNNEMEISEIYQALKEYNPTYIKENLDLLVNNGMLNIRIEEIMPPNIYYTISNQGKEIITVFEAIAQSKL
ncbi:winged helix-turn-helix transcriptional regulator [Mammaliicoccus stepanovicii]|uniref:HxlR-like helix-turn-helix n=1 Tax=Mammaliicoccus stepanovicii TaxID=643214 RepID=A0A239YD33_9STAP|nr:winged helix-turn-helix transcriptional regulator [Mammaliicoccus stepanovicii]PNZ75533.1 hypothetical protein CD111_07590 [Mammaliicoccus stepanovicii]GGI42609.1 hypothetical protein GCM10010896_19270 [Mammaliicoccus stepanovicii]SNV56610.1 HxlR-like helix-turn-helix [Mammaliicoccus stepanovicii]